MKTFRLVGRATVFKLVKQHTYFGIECVTGHTLDGKFQTTARVADILWLNS
jgi:hypothetical protein